MSVKFENKKMNYMELDLEIKSIDEDDDNYVFSGWASTFNDEDRGGDDILRGSFKKSLKKRQPVLLWQHQKNEPIGVLEAKEKEYGLWIVAKMPKSDTFVSGRVYPQLKVGSIKKMSIGYNPIDYYMEKRGKRDVRVLKEIDLWEVSLVTFPMNENADVVDVKSVVPYQDLPFPKDENGEIDIEVRWSSSQALNRVREFVGAEDGPNEKYKKAFLWYDKDNQDNFGSYKLPVADIIDGKMVVVPRAVFAAAAAMSGARGGLDIPDEDISKVKANINRYYEKMDKESPLKKGFVDYINSFANITDFSRFLKDFGLSQSETNALIARAKHVIIKNDSLNDSFTEQIKKLNDDILVKLKNNKTTP